MLDPKDRIREEVRFTKTNNRKMYGYIFHCKECEKERWIRVGNETQSSEICGKCSYKVRDLKYREKNPIFFNGNVELRNCTLCNIDQEIDKFISRGFILNKCLKCRRLHKFKISFKDYLNLLEKQNNVCGICYKSETVKDPRTGKVRDLSVDHCHQTGKVRGLLCQSCNMCLGKMGDTIESIENILKYLKNEK